MEMLGFLLSNLLRIGERGVRVAVPLSNNITRGISNSNHKRLPAMGLQGVQCSCKTARPTPTVVSGPVWGEKRRRAGVALGSGDASMQGSDLNNIME